MKKNVKLVKYALMGMLSFGLVATTFTSCKDYDDDIDNLQQQINTVVKDLSDLKTQIGDKGVSSVTFDEKTGVLTVVDGTGSHTYNIQTSAESVGIKEVTMDGKDLKVDGKVIGQVGDKVEVKDGELTVNGEATGIIVGKYAVITDKTTQKVTIKIPNATGEVEEVTLPLYNPASAITALLPVLEAGEDGKDLEVTYGIIANTVDFNGITYTKDMLTTKPGTILPIIINPATVDPSELTFELVTGEGKSVPFALTGIAEHKEALTRSITTSTGMWKLNVVANENAKNQMSNWPKRTTPPTNQLTALSVKVGSVYTPFVYTVGAEWVNTISALTPANFQQANVPINKEVNIYENSVATQTVFASNTDKGNILNHYFTLVDPTDAQTYGVSINGDNIQATNPAAVGKIFKLKFHYIDLNGKKYGDGDASNAAKDVTVKFTSATYGESVLTPITHTLQLDNASTTNVNETRAYTDLTKLYTDLGDELGAFKRTIRTVKVTKISKAGETAAIAGTDYNSTIGIANKTNVPFDVDLYSKASNGTISPYTISSTDGLYGETNAILIGFDFDQTSTAKPGKYVVSLSFEDGVSNVLKTATLDIEVKAPSFDAVFTKKVGYWNENILRAYPGYTTTPTTTANAIYELPTEAFVINTAVYAPSITYALSDAPQGQTQWTLNATTGVITLPTTDQPKFYTQERTCTMTYKVFGNANLEDKYVFTITPGTSIGDATITAAAPFKVKPQIGNELKLTGANFTAKDGNKVAFNFFKNGSKAADLRVDYANTTVTFKGGAGFSTYLTATVSATGDNLVVKVVQVPAQYTAPIEGTMEIKVIDIWGNANVVSIPITITNE